MTTQPYTSRRISSILPIALASLLILGTSRIIFDNLKNKPGSLLFPWQIGGWFGGFQLGNLRTEGNGKLVDRYNESEDVVDIEDCNVFEGRWVWDNVSRPLYKEGSCSSLVKQVTCQRNGRPDNFYQFWRWQPNECNLPRFDALRLLEVLRNKRLMFVGDSIQRGQFDSMVCLLQSAVPDDRRLHYKVPPKKIFHAMDFNATVEFYWAPFIVESNSDHSTNHSVQRRMVKLDRVANHSKNWEGVDFLVFESYVWWMYKPIINATFNDSDDKKEYNVTTAYRIALQTWSKWVETTINPDKQRVFFMSLSPTHLWKWEWSTTTHQQGNCYNETDPISNPLFRGVGTSQEIMNIVRETLESLSSKVEVTLLNITQLSDYRKDAHTSVYTERKGKLLTKQQKGDPDHFADCIHWCLPGVPDTWNEILYAHLLQY